MKKYFISLLVVAFSAFCAISLVSALSCMPGYSPCAMKYCCKNGKEVCRNGRCVPIGGGSIQSNRRKCKPGEFKCGRNCCKSYEICRKGRCQEKSYCKEGRFKCGTHCCFKGKEVCRNGFCYPKVKPCPSGKKRCGRTKCCTIGKEKCVKGRCVPIIDETRDRDVDCRKCAKVSPLDCSPVQCKISVSHKCPYDIRFDITVIRGRNKVNYYSATVYKNDIEPWKDIHLGPLDRTDKVDWTCIRLR